MKIAIIHQNVQGLNENAKVDVIKNYYQKHLGNTEIVCFQEHKLRGSRLQAISGILWKGAGFFSQEARVAYNNDSNEDGAGSGGISMWIALKLLHLICESGHTRGGNAQWIRFNGMPGLDLAVLNIYALHLSWERCLLWEELLALLPRDCRWVFSGDWNFVERAIDKSNLKESIVSEMEKRVFEELKGTFQLKDPFLASNRIRFSWDSKRKDGVMACLDRTYAFSTTGVSTTGANYRIFGDCVHSDHLPVWRRLWLEPESKRKSTFVMNARYLAEVQVQDNFKKIWEANRNLAFFGKVRRCVKFYKTFCKKWAEELKREEGSLRRQVENVAASLQVDPSSQSWQAEMATAADRLKTFEKRKIEGLRLRSRLKWKEVGDQCSKEFFQFFQSHRARSNASHITELKDEHGQTHISQAVMVQICSNYYQKLYTAREAPEVATGAQEAALRYVKDKLSPRMKTSLQAPLTQEELRLALWDMFSGKSPGPDGIVLEFYKICWYFLGVEFTCMINVSVREGRLPPGVTQGMIVLLHKGGDKQALTNWRPITLLNLGYKIYAKALQLRLQPVLMEVISPDQSAFLPLRFILDNLLVTQETMAWAESSNQPLIFLKLDFSKAYDMVEWKFMYMILEKLGFPQVFIRMISLLFQDASACVKLNGEPSPYFLIQRGVRQGCPLAPYLFIIVAEVLNAMVTQELREGRVQGISLPFEGRQQIIAQYADDTSFTLLGVEEKVRCLVYLLETFCLATGLVLNWSKSSGYWKQKGNVVRPPWTDMLGISWADEEGVSKLLGVPLVCPSQQRTSMPFCSTNSQRNLSIGAPRK